MTEAYVEEYQYYCKRCDMFADTVAVFNKAKGRAEVQHRCPGCMAPAKAMETEKVRLSEDEFIEAVTRQDEAVQVSNRVNATISSLPPVGGR